MLSKKTESVITMKKVLAGILSAILGVFGVIAVDQTIETRVSTLEVEVSELREQISAQNNVKTFKVGDEIQAPQEIPFVIESTYSYSVYDKESGDTYFFEEDVAVTITSASAVITAIDEDDTSYAHYRYPYTVCVKISGSVDPKFAGKRILLSTLIDDIGSHPNDSTPYATIAADGTFSFEDSDVDTSEKYLDALLVLRADISNQP